jgi:peroxiredoxin
MYPIDDEMSARLQAQYERTNDLVRGMAEPFQDLWAFADNRAAVKVVDGTVYGVSEIVEALRDVADQLWLTFALLDADEGDIASFEQLAAPGGTLVLKSRALGTITLRYDLIVAVLVDEDAPDEDDDEEETLPDAEQAA